MKKLFFRSITPPLVLLSFFAKVAIAQLGSAGSNEKTNAVKEQLRLFRSDKSPRTMHRAVQMAGTVPLDKTANDWEKRRDSKLALLLSVLAAIEDALDPKFDPNDPPPLHAFPPIEAGNIYSGMPPSAIKNPVLRTQYEAAIEENQKRLAHFNQESALRLVRHESMDDIVQFIKHSYGEKEHSGVDKIIEDSLTAPKLKTSLQEALKAATKAP